MSQKKPSFFERLSEAGSIVIKEVTDPVNIANAIIMGIQLKAANFLIDGAINKGKDLLNKKASNSELPASDITADPSVSAINS